MFSEIRLRVQQTRSTKKEQPSTRVTHKDAIGDVHAVFRVAGSIWHNVSINKLKKCVFINHLKNAPTKSSTYCLLLLIKMLSWRFCGRVDFLKLKKRYVLRDKVAGAADQVDEERAAENQRDAQDRDRWCARRVSHHVFFKWFWTSPFPHKSVNLFFIMIKG